MEKYNNHYFVLHYKQPNFDVYKCLRCKIQFEHIKRNYQNHIKFEEYDFYGKSIEEKIIKSIDYLLKDVREDFEGFGTTNLGYRYQMIVKDINRYKLITDYKCEDLLVKDIIT